MSHAAHSWKFLGACKPMRTTAMEMDFEDTQMIVIVVGLVQ